MGGIAANRERAASEYPRLSRRWRTQGLRSQAESEGQRQRMPTPATHASAHPAHPTAHVRRSLTPAARSARHTRLWVVALGARAVLGRRIPMRVKVWWRRAARWFLANTFAPPWLPPRWRRPEVGYAGALLAAIAATAITGVLSVALPDFPLPGVVALLGIVL